MKNKIGGHFVFLFDEVNWKRYYRVPDYKTFLRPEKGNRRSYRQPIKGFKSIFWPVVLRLENNPENFLL
jgi:hypothetical protein